MRNGLTWEGMLGDLQPKQPWPSTAKLTAYALYDGTCTNDKAGETPCTTQAYDCGALHGCAGSLVLSSSGCGIVHHHRHASSTG